MKNKIIIWSFIVLFIAILFSVNCSKKKSPTSPQPTSTPYYTPTIADNSLYGFETSTTMGWNGYTNGITGTANSTYIAYYGTHSLAIECNFTASESSSVFVQPPSVTNLTGKIIVARIWIPANFPSGGGGAIYIESGSNSEWQQGIWTNFTSGQWNTLMFNTANPSYSSGSGADLTNVKELGIQMNCGTAAYTGNLYLDDVELDNAPPNPTNTPIPSNTPGPGTPTNTPTVTFTPVSGSVDDSRIQYFGRWDKSDPANYRADWGNVYIKANFTGTSVGINMWDESGTNMYAYSIDGAALVQFLGSTTTSYALASGLANTNHSLTFMRLTDCQAATGSDIDAITDFYGLTSANGGTFALITPTARPAKKMEFIGDSISVGTKDECTASGCNNSNTDENGYLAFGPQTAINLNSNTQLDAEWSIIARGGLGVYYNYGEVTYTTGTELHAADYYVQTLYHSATPQWDFSTWQPDAVVIALGTNDWGTNGYLPGDANFENAYESFIALIRLKYPNTVIFCMEIIPSPTWSQFIEGTADIKAVVSYENTTMGDANVHFLAINDNGPLLSSSDYAGDNTHPLAEGHTKIMNHIVPQIKTVMGW